MRPLLAVTLLAALAACKDDVRVYTTAKAAGAKAPAAAVGVGGERSTAELPPGHPPIDGLAASSSFPVGAVAPTGSLHWKTPEKWTELPGSGMRLATLKAPGEAELSIVLLPGTAGGELDNVNRWRGQLGLGPVDAAGLASGSKRVPSAAGQSLLVAFSGAEGRRLAAAILSRSGETWFFKLSGPAAAVAAAEPAFAAFLGSLHEASH